jgi:hypothetical protein
MLLFLFVQPGSTVSFSGLMSSPAKLLSFGHSPVEILVPVFLQSHNWSPSHDPRVVVCSHVDDFRAMCCNLRGAEEDCTTSKLKGLP